MDVPGGGSIEAKDETNPDFMYTKIEDPKTKLNARTGAVIEVDGGASCCLPRIFDKTEVRTESIF
jgi:hypothetical protein